MCGRKILKHSEYGYVSQCEHCNKIQVAFATTVMTMSHKEFLEHIKLVDRLQKLNMCHPFKDEKIIHVPTSASAVTLIYTVTEIKQLLHLLIEGRNKIEHNKLFVFNEN